MSIVSLLSPVRDLPGDSTHFPICNLTDFFSRDGPKQARECSMVKMHATEV